ncbi:calnexin [Tilletia horrida]|uniref:Calnexin n=1 Tax=Tilletia horrida TaxID=155126 RepID=A0AAN6JU86_9BASI|nr:calnexin [Tilletia horrida]KAK0551908.1 calnexin [Tilletia horrida]KAK0568672.1 calnexin [Tilletia horrida]
MKSQQVAVAAALLASTSSVLASADAHFEPTNITAPFIEQFGPDWTVRWTPSSATKQQEGGEVFSYNGKWEVEEPTELPGIPGDAGLVVKSEAAQHAISALFPKPIDPKGKPLVVQYEVKLQKGLQCGGAYLKLLTESPEGIQAKEFSDKTPYTIMFGPDKCGSTNKVHFIFRRKNPKTGEFEEKHLNGTPFPKSDLKKTGLYTLIIKPDNTYEILIDNESVKTGTLHNDFTPSVEPPKTIPDPDEKQPEDWVTEPYIKDPKAVKPDDWDEDAPETIPDESAEKPEGWLEDEALNIPDPEATKPEEWDDEEDGEWVAPTIPNPKCADAPGCGKWVRPTVPNPAYKGKWFAPNIDNPEYKGVWQPKQIPNPEYYEDKNPSELNPIAGVGFEIWTMQSDILFDNIYVGHSPEDARAFAAQTFDIKNKLEEGKEKEAREKATAEVEKAAKDPVKKAQVAVRSFLEQVQYDPKAAAEEHPYVAGALLAGGVAALGGLLSVLGAVFGGSSSAAKAKKTVQEKSKSAAASVKSTAVAAKESATDAKKRVAAGKSE